MFFDFLGLLGCLGLATAGASSSPIGSMLSIFVVNLRCDLGLLGGMDDPKDLAKDSLKSLLLFLSCLGVEASSCLGSSIETDFFFVLSEQSETSNEEASFLLRGDSSSSSNFTAFIREKRLLGEMRCSRSLGDIRFLGDALGRPVSNICTLFLTERLLPTMSSNCYTSSSKLDREEGDYKARRSMIH